MTVALNYHSGFRNFRLAWARAFRECRPLGASGILSIPWVTQSIIHLARGDHAHLISNASRLLKINPTGVGLFYLAHSQFLNGRYDECLSSLNAFLAGNPHHPDGCYLLAQVFTCEAYQDRNDRALAWRTLEELAKHSRRPKTWLVMANLVQNSDDFQRLHTAWLSAKKAGLTPAFNADINNYLSIGALRAGEYGIARQIWRDTIAQMESAPSPPKKAKKHSPAFTPRHGAVALRDVTRALSRHDIQSFLVSGTLLGCIREGQLLGHDKDIDIGVWEDAPRHKLLKAVATCGKFYIQPSRAPETIRLKHVNGTAIDVFYHYREDNKIWHGGVKARWYNSRFSLTERKFLGGRYLIPKDYERYLVENYGQDWRVPKPVFDCVYDTPNAVIINDDEMAVHDYRILMQSIENSNRDRCQSHAGELVSQTK